jgi:hypothetical protein
MLPQEEFVLVSVEALEDHRAEFGPVSGGQEVFDRLEPTFGGTNEVHGRHTNPHWRFDGIHLKVIHSAGDPELRVFAIKFWKLELGKATQVGGVGKDVAGCRGRMEWRIWWRSGWGIGRRID